MLALARHFLSLLMVFTLSLVTMAIAAPRVAIVTPLHGQVTLAGVPIKGPQLAEEGQSLTLSSTASARVQLLGSSKEAIISGVSHYVIKRSTLEENGKTLSRGKLSVVGDLSGLSRAAALSARAQEGYARVNPDGQYTPIGAYVTLPPLAQADSSWCIPLRILGNTRLDSSHTLTITIEDTANKQDSWIVLIEEPIDMLELPAHTLKYGHRYSVKIASESGHYYVRYFYLLTDGERQTIADHATLLRKESDGVDQINTFLRLASLYSSVDDTEQTASVLEELIQLPNFKTELDNESQAEILTILNSALGQLDRAPYPIPSKPTKVNPPSES